MPTTEIERSRSEHSIPPAVGINHIAFDPVGGGLAFSDMSMNVVRMVGDRPVAKANLSSPNEKVRPTERIRGLAFSPDSRHLFVAAADTLYALNALDLSVVWIYEPPRSFGFLIISPSALAVSRNGDLAASFDNGSMAVWDSSLSLKALWQDNDTPRTLSFSADGRELTGSDSFTICSWDVASRTKRNRLRLPDRAFGTACHPDKPLVAIRTLQRMELWDLSQGRSVCQATTSPGLPICTFHPENSHLFVGSRNGVTEFDASLCPIRQFAVSDANVLSLALRPLDFQLTMGLSTGELRSVSV